MKGPAEWCAACAAMFGISIDEVSSEECCDMTSVVALCCGECTGSVYVDSVGGCSCAVEPDGVLVSVVESVCSVFVESSADEVVDPGDVSEGSFVAC